IDDKLFRAYGQDYNGKNGIQAWVAAWPFGSTTWDAPSAHPNNPVISGAGPTYCVTRNPHTGDFYCWGDTFRGKWTRATNSFGSPITTSDPLQRSGAAMAFDTRR